MNPYTIDMRDSAPELHNLQQTIALELALGCSLPKMPSDWPNGLAHAWNEAAEAGAFTKGCTTLGAMARAFLAFRIEKLND